MDWYKNIDRHALINADWLAHDLRAHIFRRSCKKRAIKAFSKTCWSLTKAWRTQWKMLVGSLVEVWSASRRPAPQVAQPKHLLCESSVGGCEVCLPRRSQWKNHTHAVLWHAIIHVLTPTLRLPRSACGCQTWCPDCVPFAPTGNSRLSLASAERIFRSPIRVSDALLICQHLFLSPKAAAALLYPTPCHPNANPSLGAKVGTADESQAIGCN